MIIEGKQYRPVKKGRRIHKGDLWFDRKSNRLVPTKISGQPYHGALGKVILVRPADKTENKPTARKVLIGELIQKGDYWVRQSTGEKTGESSLGGVGYAYWGVNGFDLMRPINEGETKVAYEVLEAENQRLKNELASLKREVQAVVNTMNDLKL